MKEKKIYLHKISTCVPEHFYTQEFGLNFLLELLGDTEKKRNFLTKVYTGSAINKRHTVINDYGKEPEDYTFYPKNKKMLPEPSTMQRNDLYIKESNRLSLKAVNKLLKELPRGLKNKITHIITISCTGFSAPGFDFYILKKLNLSPDIDRFHIGFMGCYAAFTGMKLARQICLADDNARVLMVNVELCSLHFQQKFEPDIVVANAIFSDGISAALISADQNDSKGEKLVLHSFTSHYIADSEDDMAWKIGLYGFDMKLSYYVPKLIDANIMKILGILLKKAGYKREEIDIWAIHPGGKAILEKLEKTLNLNRLDLKYSYDVLWEYGNMSSSTIMFVLDRIINESIKGKIFAIAFGPGLTVESGLLEKI
ncbi:MAG: type III polyketide synthase [Spirochaetes bacterium]|nr:type III polyketide synthase [Spirochaetota bacterium]